MFDFGEGRLHYRVCDNLNGTQDGTDDPRDAWESILEKTKDPDASVDMVIWMLTKDGHDSEVVTAMFGPDTPYRVVTTCLDNGLLAGFSVWGFPTCEEA